jgi:hypothetical protein
MTAGLLQVNDKTVIQFARIAWRLPGIKNITGNDDGINLMRLGSFQQPVQEGFMFSGAAFAVKILTQMPVRGVKYAHNGSVAKK